MFYIKYGKHTYHFVGHSKSEPFEYVAFFKRQENSDELTASIASSTVAKSKKNILLHLLQVSKIHIMKCQVKSHQ